jgi:uncharacterized protein (TIGR03435 family)
VVRTHETLRTPGGPGRPHGARAGPGYGNAAGLLSGFFRRHLRLQPRRILAQRIPCRRSAAPGVPLTFLVQRAFANLSSDQVIGLQGAANSGRFDINAKTAASIGTNPDQETMGALVLSLLKERFGLKYHTEKRLLPAYSLVAVKPKLKKADPASRTHCLRSNGPAGSPASAALMP